MHEVSPDGQMWSSAKDFPELFVKAANAGAWKGAPEESEYAIQPSAPGSPAKSSISAAPAATTNDGWYFAMGDKQQGPVDFATLSHLFTSGQLTSESQVWRDGMASWTSARNVEALSALVINRPTTPHSTNVASNRDGELSLSIANAAASAKGWLVFIFLSGYVTSVLGLLAGIAVLILGAKTNVPFFVVPGLAGMLVATAILVGAILLSHYNASVSRFMVQRSEHNLCDAFASLARVWTYCGLAVAMIYALTVISGLLILSISTGGLINPVREPISANDAIRAAMKQSQQISLESRSYREQSADLAQVDVSQCPQEFQNAFSKLLTAITDVDTAQVNLAKYDGAEGIKRFVENTEGKGVIGGGAAGAAFGMELQEAESRLKTAMSVYRERTSRVNSIAKAHSVEIELELK